MRYASAFARDAYDAALSLDELGERGRIVPEFHNPAIRELLVGAYRLIYRVNNGTIDVLGVIHGARDLRRLWQQERRELL